MIKAFKGEHSQELKASWFDYQLCFGRDGPDNILAKYKGFLQTCSYSAYNRISVKEDIVHLGCMAHIRRYSIDALDSDATSVLTI